MAKPKLTQQVFEARYERGYRYLDRCGEAMLILEELLPNETGKVWMPDQIAPTGAKLKCPELDVTLVFDAYRLIVDHSPVEAELDLGPLAAMVYATISARFDLRVVTRFGCRRFHMIGTDSIDQAQALSAKMSPFSSWPEQPGDGMKFKAAEVVSTCENEDGSRGYRLSMRPMSKVEAPAEIDSRLLLPSRQLPHGQRDALLDQLRRQQQREKNPLAGVVVDVDYYVVRPTKSDVAGFVADAVKLGDRLVGDVVREKGLSHGT